MGAILADEAGTPPFVEFSANKSLCFYRCECDTESKCVRCAFASELGGFIAAVLPVERGWLMPVIATVRGEQPHKARQPEEHK